MKKREAALEKEGAEVKVKKEVAVEEKKEEEDVAVREPDVSMECFIFLWSHSLLPLTDALIDSFWFPRFEL